MMESLQDVAEQGSACRWFEDFELGERFALPARVMTDGVFKSFLDASGETIPLESGMAHGFQVLIQTAAGAGRFHDMIGDALIGLVEQSSRFAKPVYAGDELKSVLQVVELSPNSSTGVISLRSTVHNQRRELVLEGVQKYLLRRRP